MISFFRPYRHFLIVFGPFLAPVFCAIQGPNCDHFGPFWGDFGRFLGWSGSFWGHFGIIWSFVCHFGTSLGPFGEFFSYRFWRFLGLFRPKRGHFGTFLMSPIPPIHSPRLYTLWATVTQGAATHCSHTVAPLSPLPRWGWAKRPFVSASQANGPE